MRRDLIDPRTAYVDRPDWAAGAQPGSLSFLAEKYLRPGEHDLHDVFMRIASSVAGDDAQRRRFLEAMQSGLLPAGRIAANAGTGLNATLVNCFVQPIGDALSGEDSELPGILRALQDAAATLRMGGGVGYDFSAIRPKGAPVSASASIAAGPIAFMRVFDAMCSAIEATRARRGAQMAVLRCDHPDIEAFIQAKRLSGELSTFCLSVAITDGFMEAVEHDASFELVHASPPSHRGAQRSNRDDGRWLWRTVRARSLWDSMIRAAHACGDPGMIFVDTINRLNNLSDREQIEAVNPCAEQPLPAWGACVLGSIDLGRVVRHPFTARADIDWATLGGLVHTGVELLDRVLDVTRWPAPRQAAEAQTTRRIGLGFLGLADALTMLGQRYGSSIACDTASAITRFMCIEAYRASSTLARLHGAFPAFNAERFLASPHFASTLPEDLKGRIARHGLRNSHLMCIAPTGSLSLACADNASSGIEPAFAARFTRVHAQPDGSPGALRMTNRAVRLWQRMHTGQFSTSLPPAFIAAGEVTAAQQVAMLEAVAPWVDAGISKTLLLATDAPVGLIADMMRRAWHSGIKGLTVFRSDDRHPGVLLRPAGHAPVCLRVRR